MEREQSLSREVLGDKIHCFVWKDKNPVGLVNTICGVRDFVRRKQSDESVVVVECPSTSCYTMIIWEERILLIKHASCIVHRKNQKLNGT